jgi:arsenite methyltransferase
MFKDDIQQLVADAYTELAHPGAPGLSFYPPEQLARLPASASEWALGVGNPLAHAALAPGEHVVDLGCGAGVDALLAAEEVGPWGRVTGVDMLSSMVARARAIADEAGVAGVEFVTAEMEALPLDDDTVDVVISNGSINLSARKSRVLSEAFRVLRPGGRLVVSDLTIREEELPIEVITHPSAWAG